MENSEKKLANGGYHIKVKKKQKCLNNKTNTLSDDLPSLNTPLKTQNLNNKTIKNKNNDCYFQNGLEKKNFDKLNLPSSTNNKDCKYKKINVYNRYNKSENKPSNMQIYTNLNIKKNIIKLIDSENDTNLYSINKSETQYPLKKKYDSGIITENSNKSMRNINYKNNYNSFNEKFFDTKSKYNMNIMTEVRKKVYSKKNYKHNTAIKVKNIEKYREKLENVTIDKLGNFNKTRNKKNNNNDYFISNENDVNNFPTEKNLSCKTYHKINYKKKYYSKLNNNIDNINKKNLFTHNNDKILLNIYKKKLITIFVSLMTNIYNKQIKKHFNEFIYNIRNFSLNDSNKKYKKIKKENKEGEYEDNKTNCFYTKKINLKINNDTLDNNNISDDNFKNNFSKTIFNDINFSTMSKYRRFIRNKNSDLNKSSNKFATIKNTDNINSDEFPRNSAYNLYIPSKNRNNNFITSKSKQKESIFEDLKIKKNSNSNKNFPKFYKNKNLSINSQINNFYNTNNNNFYINRINSFNSIISLEKHPRILKIKNGLTDISNDIPLNNVTKESNNTLKTSKVKNKSKFENIFYKKIFPKEKIINKNEQKNDNTIKKVEKYKRIEKESNYDIKNRINQTYTKGFLNNNDKYKKHFSTISNYTNKNGENNNNTNNEELSNDINYYCLNNIDKPTNMIGMKYDINTPENEDENEEGKLNIYEKECNNLDNEQNNKIPEIKNLIQMITNDKRLFLNFNYIKIEQYNKKFNRKNNNLYKSKINFINILSNNRKNNKNKININNPHQTFNPKIYFNSNKYVKKKIIKNGLLKLDNIINNKLFEYKYIFFEFLKKLKYIIIIIPIINKRRKILKKYFDIFKNNILNKEITKKINKRKMILNKKNMNFNLTTNKSPIINNLKEKDKSKSFLNKISPLYRNRNIYKENGNKTNYKAITSSDKVDNSENDDEESNFKKKVKETDINDMELNEGKKNNIYLKKKIKIKSLNTSKANEDI